jgi:hypothetical protein
MKVVTASLIGLLVAAPAFAQTIATWSFESSLPSTSGPIAPEVGSGSASIFHASASTYSSPAGNGSSHSYSSNGWSVNDYYQFQASSLGDAGLSLTWDQTSSSTGPKDFGLSYSTDGVNFTNVENYTVLVNGSPNPAWNGTTTSSLYTNTVNLSSVAALDNQATVYFRLTDLDTVAENGGAVQAAGTDRVDNVSITAVPEPATYALILGAASFAFGLGRNKRRRFSS